MSAYKKACAEGQAPHYQGSIMAVGKSAAGKTSFKKRLTGEEINEEHLVTNALETDLCTIDIANVSQAWETHAKERTDLLEDEILVKVKDFMEEQHVKQPAQPKRENTKIQKASRPLPPLPTVKLERKKKKQSKLIAFFSRLGMKKETNTKEINVIHVTHDRTHREMESLAASSVSKAADNVPEAAHSVPKRVVDLPPEDRSRLEMIANLEKPHDLLQARTKDHSLIKVWDFGGQKVYYVLHTVFLRVTCVYVLVLDLSTETTGDNRQRIPEMHFDSFEYWLNTILSHLRKGDQKVAKGNVIILGTHLDKLHEDKMEQRRLAECYFKQLKGKLKTKQHRNLIVEFFAVDNLAGDHETYERIRETLLEAVKANCHLGEMRPIRYLQLTQSLQFMQKDTSLSQLERNLVPFSKVVKMAKQYNISTERDVKAYLEFSHHVGDVTYFDTPELQDFIMPNPQWLSGVFRAVITIEQFYPNDAFPENEVHALTMLKKDGMLDRKGSLLSLLWEPFISHEEPLYANLQVQAVDKQLQKKAVEYLLKLMIQFDLVVPLTDERCLVPCLLPFSTKPMQQNFPDMAPITPPLYLIFHSSLESFEDFKLNCETGDQFLPHGFFHRLISRCVKQDWQWKGEKYQNVAYFLVDDSMIRLSTKSTWIKIEAWVQNGSVAIPSQYYNEIKSAINSLIDTYTPNMWVELCVNPCAELSKECLQSIGVTSLGGKGHLVRCPDHERGLATKDFNVWLQPIEYQVPKYGGSKDKVHHVQDNMTVKKVSAIVLHQTLRLRG